MSSSTTTPAEGIPRTANLLACKQWWRVCFLYGDQEKYYRQIYGKAASQRIAMSAAQQSPGDVPSSETTVSDDFKQQGLNMAPTLFPMKHPSRRRSKIHSDRFRQSASQPKSTEIIKPNSKVTVLDDPFLFGLNEHANLSEDSGIDNAAFETTTTTNASKSKKLPKLPSKTSDFCNDLKINENELRMLYLKRNRSGAVFCSNDVSFSFSEHDSSVLSDSKNSSSIDVDVHQHKDDEQSKGIQSNGLCTPVDANLDNK